jgi:hypothetical protein
MFNVIPAGKQLLITDVSCSVGVSSSGQPINLAIASLMTMGTDRMTHIPSIRTNTIGAGEAGDYTVSGAVKHIFKSGERPLVRLVPSTTGGFGGHCTIAGKIGNPPTD